MSSLYNICKDLILLVEGKSYNYWFDEIYSFNSMINDNKKSDIKKCIIFNNYKKSIINIQSDFIPYKFKILSKKIYNGSKYTNQFLIFII